MPRRARCLVDGVPHHVTQRGVDRCPVFESDFDRHTYLRLLRDQLAETPVRLLGWCLMTNHVHLVLLPEHSDGLGVVLRRVHGRYAQYFNVRSGRTGHLWQNRYFACPLGPAQVRRALVYVDCNPIRAGMVEAATDYPWSSAAAHAGGADPTGILDGDWQRLAGISGNWGDLLRDAGRDRELEACTYSGRPFGDVEFVTRIGEQFGRQWTRGRPKKKAKPLAELPDRQASLFAVWKTGRIRLSLF